MRRMGWSGGEGAGLAGIAMAAMEIVCGSPGMPMGSVLRVKSQGEWVLEGAAGWGLDSQQSFVAEIGDGVQQTEQWLACMETWRWVGMEA